MIDYKGELGRAVQHFWRTRASQQGDETGGAYAGSRGAVVGGRHPEGFIRLVGLIVKEAGVDDVCIHTVAKRARMLPGYFRPSKEWDLVVTSGSELLAALEVKSQVGSFGNNFNNRVEEALGNATDFWKAYEYGAFKPSQKPWLGYMFMLEETPVSLRPTQRLELSPFKVDEAFQTRSYARRYELVCERLLRERLYDAACFFTSNSEDGKQGRYNEPNSELSIEKFAISLYARATAFAKLSRRR